MATRPTKTSKFATYAWSFLRSKHDTADSGDREQSLLEQAVLFGVAPRGDVAALVAMSGRQARRLVRPLVDRGLLTGAKDAPLRIAFPLGESERLLPHLWAPAGVAMTLNLPPEVGEALRPPRAA
jgi:hypothetical protein